ncbi:hypothetical protein M3215_15875 [Bacillus cytotoxicus]|uniref:Uncharacterized protein n=1 Tax=Bacillus cytotoxicus TaxID=580165 RepID=A0ACC6ABG5_9BACI|nr:hypothetical protein [Bacillus cytotoxicus]
MKVWKDDMYRILGVWSLLAAYIVLTMSMRYSWLTVYQSLAVLGVPIIAIVWYFALRNVMGANEMFIRGMRVTIYLAYAWSCWMLRNIYGFENENIWLSVSWLLPALYLYFTNKRPEWYVLGGGTVLYFLSNLDEMTWFVVSHKWESIMITIASVIWYRLERKMPGRYLFYTASLLGLWMVYLACLFEGGEPNYWVKVVCAIFMTVTYIIIFKKIQEGHLYKITTGAILISWSLYALIDITNLFVNLTMNLSYILIGLVGLFVVISQVFFTWQEKKNQTNIHPRKIGEYVLYVLVSSIGSVLFLASLYFILWETVREGSVIMIVSAMLSVLAIFGHKKITAKFLRIFLFVFGIMAGITTLVTSHHYIWGLLYASCIFGYWLFTKYKAEQYSLWWLLEGVIASECMRAAEYTMSMSYLVFIHIGFFIFAIVRKNKCLLRNSIGFGMIYVFFYLLAKYEGADPWFIISAHSGYILLLVLGMLYVRDTVIKRIGIVIYLFTNFIMYETNYIGNYGLSWMLFLAGIVLLLTNKREKQENIIKYNGTYKKKHVWLVGILSAFVLLGTVGQQEWNYYNSKIVLLELENLIKEMGDRKKVWFSFKIEAEANEMMLSRETKKEPKVPVFIKLKRDQDKNYHIDQIKLGDNPKEKGIWIKGYMNYGYVTIGSTREVPVTLVKGEGKYAKIEIAKNGNSRVIEIQ